MLKLPPSKFFNSAGLGNAQVEMGKSLWCSAKGKTVTISWDGPG